MLRRLRERDRLIGDRLVLAGGGTEINAQQVRGPKQSEPGGIEGNRLCQSLPGRERKDSGSDRTVRFVIPGGLAARASTAVNLPRLKASVTLSETLISQDEPLGPLQRSRPLARVPFVDQMPALAVAIFAVAEAGVGAGLGSAVGDDCAGGDGDAAAVADVAVAARTSPRSSLSRQRALEAQVRLSPELPSATGPDRLHVGAADPGSVVVMRFPSQSVATQRSAEGHASSSTGSPGPSVLIGGDAVDQLAPPSVVV